MRTPTCGVFLLCSMLLLSAPPLRGQEAAADASMDEVVVTGEFPGPGLWKVTRPGDDTHVLWIVGDPWPLPKKMKWKSRDIEAAAVGAQEILLDAGFTMKPDEQIGMLRGMTYLPALLKARKNPEAGKLQDVLPPDLYARWLVQKKLYLGRESGVEKWRPIFAADKLRKAAFDELGMREGGAVAEVVQRLIKKHKLKVNAPMLTFTFKRAELRDRIREFSRESLADRECFATTLALTEALANREVEKERARAWATADLQRLATLPALPNPYLSCVMAVMNAQVARDLVPADVREQATSQWLEAADASLARNASTFAVVNFPKLTRADGYLDRLRARGYVVEPPR
jgi:hypothetical protein